MKDFIVYSEYEKAGLYVPAGRVNFRDELNLRVKTDRFDFEFMVDLIDLGSKLGVKVNIHEDAFQAFSECKEVFGILTKYQRSSNEGAPANILETIAKDLEGAGWKRKHPRKSEIKKRRPACPTCGHVRK